MPPFLNPNASAIVKVSSTSSDHGALAKIEAILESVVDALAIGAELVLPYRTIRSMQRSASGTNPPADRPADVVRFPGRTIQEVNKFGIMLRHQPFFNTS